MNYPIRNWQQLFPFVALCVAYSHQGLLRCALANARCLRAGEMGKAGKRLGQFWLDQILYTQGVLLPFLFPRARAYYTRNCFLLCPREGSRTVPLNLRVT